MLDPEASLTYYEGVIFAYDYGFASDVETRQRLELLSQNTASESLRERINPWIESEHRESDTTPEQEPNVSVECILGDIAPTNSERIRYCGPYPQTPPLLMRFFVTGIAGMRVWEFHQYDRDYFPSIPHGHHTSAKHKLDAYRGWVYEDADQVRREPRKLIVALWNDTKFRTRARRAILFYMTEYPRFRWRVRHPLRLPRP